VQLLKRANGEKYNDFGQRRDNGYDQRKPRGGGALHFLAIRNTGFGRGPFKACKNNRITKKLIFNKRSHKEVMEILKAIDE